MKCVVAELWPLRLQGPDLVPVDPEGWEGRRRKRVELWRGGVEVKKERKEPEVREKKVVKK